MPYGCWLSVRRLRKDSASLRFPRVHGDDRCRRRRSASRHPFRRTVADGRRLGRDFRSHGRGGTVCVPAWRPARAVARSRRGVSGAGSAAPTSLRDPRVIAFLLVWFGVNILFGVFSWGCRASSSRSHGRRISAASWPVFWPSPYSIRFGLRRSRQRKRARADLDRLINHVLRDARSSSSAVAGTLRRRGFRPIISAQVSAAERSTSRAPAIRSLCAQVGGSPWPDGAADGRTRASRALSTRHSAEPEQAVEGGDPCTSRTFSPPRAAT